MSFEESVQKPEEIIFYIDIITNFLKKKNILKGIKDFIEEKNKYKISSPSAYGLVIFQAETNPVNIYGKEDTDSIINTINESWDSREQQNSYLENGLFEIFSYIFWKSRTDKKLYRVIIITDKPSGLPEDYYNAVYGLILKAKKFSVCIDIIRVGKDSDYSDTVKLKIISSETQGGIFYCHDEKHFLAVLGSLVQSKEEFKIIKEEDQILDTDKAFFDHLAVDLISLESGDEEICSICNQELCPICQAYSDEINKCFNCNTKFHGCCATKYAISNNIGIKHIFRCPQCSTLLKIDEEFVEMLMSEERGESDFYTIEEVEEESVALENVREQLIEDYSEQEEPLQEAPISGPEIESVAEGTIESEQKSEAKKVRVGGFFGKEVEIKAKNAVGSENKPVQMKVVENKVVDVKKSITSLKPPKKRKTIKLCKICGATVNTMTCPVCGNRVD